jgi:hypothetical protein
VQTCDMSAIYLGISLVFFSQVFCTNAVAQTDANTYVSQADNDITIRKVAVFPVRDNLDGIYARPIEGHLTQLIKNYHQWDLAEANLTDTFATVGELEENPALVTKLGAKIEADAFLVASASKSQTGLTIKLDLFLKKDGRVLVQEILKDHPRYEISELKEQVQALFQKMIKRIPYDGMVLSRQENRVTVNLGRVDGIVQGQTLTVVQILKLGRHPKFGFLVGAEKEILGKIKVLKVEDTLSFGSVVSELDKGLIKRFHKISGLDPVTYNAPDSLEGPSSGGGGLGDRDDSKTSFGNNPGEWLPARPPSFGSIGIRVGLGSFTSSTSLTSTDTLEASSDLYPLIGLHGELWLNPHWAVRAEIEQGVITGKNPLAGSSPGELNLSTNRYSVTFGYNFLLQDDFFGPKIQLRGGIAQYSLSSPVTQPTSLTSTAYSGLTVGVAGSLPIDPQKIWVMGAGTTFFLMPRMEEKPVSSGSSNKNTINTFNVFAEKKINENLKAVGTFDISLFKSSFTGSGNRSGTSPASDMNQKHTTLSLGINYLF